MKTNSVFPQFVVILTRALNPYAGLIVARILLHRNDGKQAQKIGNGVEALSLNQSGAFHSPITSSPIEMMAEAQQMP